MSDLDSNLSKSLSKILDIEREEVIEEANSKGMTIVDGKKDDLQVDYEKTRDRINHMLDKSTAALESAISLANTSESPRAIEALSTLLKSVADLNSSLLDTHIKMKKLKDDKPEEQAAVTNNNTLVFNGTTKELKQFLENMKGKS